MFRNKICFWFLTMIFFIMGSAQVASASVPQICQTARNERAYDLGYLKGGNIVDQAWNGIDQDCTQVVDETYFKDTILFILGDLSLPVGASEFVVCHYHGYIAGASDRLKDIEETCSQQCVEDGEFIGELATMLYCELSIALDGLALDSDLIEGLLTLCDSLMVTACETTFADLTVAYQSTFGDCEPYTEGTYTAVWEQAKHNQCVVNPDTDTDSETDTDTDTDTDFDAGV